jgi:hypothetical protein
MTYSAVSWRTLVITAVAALMASALLVFSRPVEIIVDGQRVDSDVLPVTTTSDKVFVPLRSIADALGAETTYEAKSGHVYVIRGNQSLSVRVGNTHAHLDGVGFTLKHAPFRVRGRVMIALNAVARAFDVNARYDPRTARIEVTTPGIGDATTPNTTTAEAAQ